MVRFNSRLECLDTEFVEVVDPDLQRSVRDLDVGDREGPKASGRLRVFPQRQDGAHAEEFAVHAPDDSFSVRKP